MSYLQRSSFAKVYLFPTTINAFFARVRATLSRRSFFRNPICFLAFDLTQVMIMMSIYCPWKASTVETLTFFLLSSVMISLVTSSLTVAVCEEYGVIIPIVRFLSMPVNFLASRATILASC